jgi:penicillin-binding protein 1A
MQLLRILRWFIFTSFLVVAFALGGLFFIAHNKVIDFSVLEHYNPGNPSILLDDEGKEWARFALDRREPVAYEQIPQHVINAFVATEDWNFFQHSGISLKGIIRSVFVNITRGRKAQGASTITQQLVRLLFLNSKKTFVRKMKEQVVAILVEMQFTKEQIMQTYLNHVCFGCGIYGVQAACQRFWGKNVQDATIAEAATLAGIMRSPRDYCPLSYPLSCQKRRDVVLGSMKKLKFITEQEYEGAKKTPVTTVTQKNEALAPHLREWIRQYLEDMLGKNELYTGGFRVQTTLNQNIQRIAQNQFYENCKELRTLIAPNVDGALISMDVPTGEIKALVGGFNFSCSQFNRAFQARRQMGSVFKPIVYAAAMQTGMKFSDTEIDEPLAIDINGKEWTPKNYDNEFHGQMTLAYALATSCNTVAVKTFVKVGAQPIVQLAEKMRLPGPLYPYPSLALGCTDVTLKDVTGMFNVFANDGVYVEPHCIKWVKNKWGSKVWKASPVRERVLSAYVTGQVTKALQVSFNRVRTWLPQNWGDVDGISKTGTTNDSRTCWFAAATPEITTVVYIGCDDNRAMKIAATGESVYPLRTAFPIWVGLNRELTLSHKKFSFDPRLKELCINPKNGRYTTKESGDQAITILV